MNQAKMSYRKWNKPMILVVSLLLVVGITVGGTLAYLIAVDGPIKNTFTPSAITTTVDETLEGKEKKNVKITNTGDTEAYIRAAVVITWQDVNGNIYGKLPVEGTDYIIDYNIKASNIEQAANQWVLAKDGFYYWTSPVAGAVSANDTTTYFSTGILIESCKVAENATIPEGYSLNVEIIGSGIQSVPTSVVTTEWSSIQNNEKMGVIDTVTDEVTNTTRLVINEDK